MGRGDRERRNRGGEGDKVKANFLIKKVTLL